MQNDHLANVQYVKIIACLPTIFFMSALSFRLFIFFKKNCKSDRGTIGAPKDQKIREIRQPKLKMVNSAVNERPLCFETWICGGFHLHFCEINKQQQCYIYIYIY